MESLTSAWLSFRSTNSAIVPVNGDYYYFFSVLTLFVPGEQTNVNCLRINDNNTDNNYAFARKDIVVVPKAIPPSTTDVFNKQSGTGYERREVVGTRLERRDFCECVSESPCQNYGSASQIVLSHELRASTTPYRTIRTLHRRITISVCQGRKK